MPEQIIISHLRRSSSGMIEYQSNDIHSKNVAEIGRSFANEFGMGELCYVMGLLHDKGKEKKEFQDYIQDVNGIEGHTSYSSQGKAHSYVGGLLAKKHLPFIYPLIGNPLMGHHRGLYDYIDIERKEGKEIPYDEGVTDPVSLPDASLPSWFHSECIKGKDIHHVERMLFSCLVDADYLDTESFMQPEQMSFRGAKATLPDLLPVLLDYLTSFGEPKTTVNKIRSAVQRVCLEESEGVPGFYSMTVPTGGGKTISSMVWAINHAVCSCKKRIIIAIPYTSIIVQTAAVLRSIFGNENVLEHHSNTTFDDKDDSELTRQLKLATENWDYPIIVTTNVQLFESMMSNHPSQCRKLHNICNSVIILDEVQTLPIDFMQPILDTLDTYKRLFGVSVLFTTASQPALSGKYHGTNPGIVLNGLWNIKEIIPKGMDLHNRLRRVDLEIDNRACTYDEIAERLAGYDRVLCIVNTRRDAVELFNRLPEEGIRIHLSRMMCPAHISAKILEMKSALANSDNKIVRVISTQLIEAGVDIDFPVVFRQEAGLDSVLQAAGRCNREGKLDICITHVFSLVAEHPLPRGHITQCNNARMNMGTGYDWFSPKAMTDYFVQLYSRVQSFDVKDIKHYLYNPEEIMFETASKEFRLIDDDSVSVIVDWEDSMSMVDCLKHKGPSYSLMKRLGHYSVNLRKRDFEQMEKNKLIEELFDGIYIIRGKIQYDKDIGLVTDNKLLEETWIV